MSEVLPNNDQGSPTPAPDTRAPVSPRVQGIAPAWEPTEHIAPAANEPLDPVVAEAARGLLLEQADQGAMAGTAERIGSAVGTAQRQVRRGLQLVRRLPSSGAAHATQIEEEIRDRAANALHEIGQEVADMGQQAARRLDDLSEQAEEHLQQLRREISSALPRVRARLQQFADEKPLQTIGAIAGIGFALGVALRLSRRSRRG